MTEAAVEEPVAAAPEPAVEEPVAAALEAAVEEAMAAAVEVPVAEVGTPESVPGTEEAGEGEPEA